MYKGLSLSFELSNLELDFLCDSVDEAEEDEVTDDPDPDLDADSDSGSGSSSISVSVSRTILSYALKSCRRNETLALSLDVLGLILVRLHLRLVLGVRDFGFETEFEFIVRII